MAIRAAMLEKALYQGLLRANTPLHMPTTRPDKGTMCDARMPLLKGNPREIIARVLGHVKADC